MATAINTICYNDDNGFVLIDTISGGNGGPYIYSLDNANFQPDTIFAGLPAGLYSVFAADSRGCLDTVQVRVFQPSPIQITIANGHTVTIPMGEGVRLVTNVNVAPASLNYVWTPRSNLTCESDTSCRQPFVQPLDPVRYTVLVTDATNGCTSSTSILVEVEKNRNIYVPNIITPNNDGYNDKFMVYGGLGVVKIHQLKIFDRWGEMVYGASDFMPNDSNYSWDGWFKDEIMSPTVFVYYMEVEFIDGQLIPYKGDITMMR
jgi:gliding motility-associated-like protein